MISMMRKSATWATPYPGPHAVASESPALTLSFTSPTLPQGCDVHGGDQPFGTARQAYSGVQARVVTRLRDIARTTQRVQEEGQGWRVGEGTFVAPIALTAQMSAANGGAGPYPWRQPV
ncbi:hypothetical protein [Thermomonospora umbrina]|uniref:hypothetical protein n=1 Tax=Thermomonospora umbrina TaxID=111806 RepID=UPI000E24D1E3|nr:hypothetical protein [Thermomonospora umbrina]